ncbi:prepilin-type N-terminal cleavage/methylation domain-containing protein [Candidatus Saccharibacteria bacterium]|nr:prepilin-type N-terminal cleavage/methylation domain-containing protein [Candidatus Saccharibacteria bacterium]
MKKTIGTDCRGFTIIELLIATMVFSFILLLAAAGLIQVGRLYQKGVIRSQTQEVARSVMINISESIQFNGGSVSTIVDTGDTKGYCIENKRISYRLNKKLVPGIAVSPQTKYALVVDNFPGCSASSTAQNLSGGTAIGNELLSPNMRITELVITEPSNNLYQISLKIAYGDDDLFNAGNCIANRIGGAYCATASLSTTVQKRIIR